MISHDPDLLNADPAPLCAMRCHSESRTMSTLSWTPCRSNSPSNVIIFFLLAARSVPTSASKMLLHWVSLNKTPNVTLVFPSAFGLPRRFISITSKETSWSTFILTENWFFFPEELVEGDATGLDTNQESAPPATSRHGGPIEEKLKSDTAELKQWHRFFPLNIILQMLYMYIVHCI